MTIFEIQNYESLIALKINFQVIYKKKWNCEGVVWFLCNCYGNKLLFYIKKHISQHDEGEEPIC